MNRVRDHLELWESAAHAIAIDHRHAQAGGAIDRHDRVQAAGLNAHRRLHRLPDVLAHGKEGVDDIIAVWHFLDHDGRRAHHRRWHNQIVVIKFIETIKLNRAIIADGLPRHQFADVGVAAAARAQDGRAQRQIFQDRFVNDSHYFPPFNGGTEGGVAKSPMAFDHNARGVAGQNKPGALLRHRRFRCFRRWRPRSRLARSPPPWLGPGRRSG